MPSRVPARPTSGWWTCSPSRVPQGWDLDVLRRGNTRAREAYKAMFAGVDGAIMMPGAVPAHPAYAALQDLLREGRGRTVHFHWVENGSVFPLAGQPLPGRSAIDALYQRALLQTDYASAGAASSSASSRPCAPARCTSPRRAGPTCASASARGW